MSGKNNRGRKVGMNGTPTTTTEGKESAAAREKNDANNASFLSDSQQQQQQQQIQQQQQQQQQYAHAAAMQQYAQAYYYQMAIASQMAGGPQMQQKTPRASGGEDHTMQQMTQQQQTSESNQQQSGGGMFNMSNANSYMQMAMMNPQLAAAFQQQQQQTSTMGGCTQFPGPIAYNYPHGYYQPPQQQFVAPVNLNRMNEFDASKESTGGKITGTRTSRKRKSGAERTAKVCVNCQCTSSPFWRKDKSGKGSLCNACGLYSAKNNSPRPVELWKRRDNAANTLARLKQEQSTNVEVAPTSVPPNNNTSEEEGGEKKQQRNVSGSGGQNQKTASNENEACSDGDKTESVGKADQFGGNSSDENNEKKGVSEENIDDENENEKKLETRAKVVLETTGERIVVRVSEIIERRE